MAGRDHAADARRSMAQLGLQMGSKVLEPGICGSCGSDILWAFTRNGKKMPLETRKVTGLDPKTGLTHTVYESHFASCPNAKDHRREAAPSEPERKMWPSGTDPWAIVDAELEPAYLADPSLRGLLQAAGPSTIELSDRSIFPNGLTDALATIRRLRTYRVFGLCVLTVVSEQQYPPVVRLIRNPKLLELVSSKIEGAP